MKLTTLIVCALLVVPVAAGGQESVDLNSPYFVTLFEIGLRKDQTDEFKILLNQYARDRGRVIDRERRRNSPDLPGRIERKHRKVRERFLKRMDRLLDDEQFERFQAFHDELDNLLSERESLEENNRPENVYPDDT